MLNFQLRGDLDQVLDPGQEAADLGEIAILNDPLDQA